MSWQAGRCASEQVGDTLSASGIVTPASLPPPDSDIRRVFPGLAHLLSEAEPDREGRRALPVEVFNSRLTEMGHSSAAIEWAVHIGCRRAWLERTVVQKCSQRVVDRPEAEPSAALAEIPALCGTDAFRDAARAGPFTRPDYITLALSGGGLRATLFQLGILTWLAETNCLNKVTGIVSVSGGSILAAHFAKNWERAKADAEGFNQVAAELVAFARSGLRDRIIIPWLWSRLSFLWWVRKLGRTSRLLRAYERQFGDTTLGDLATPGRPQIAFVATDAIRQERVAFTADGIFQLPLEREGQNAFVVPPRRIVSTGVRLALAVAASSCFPPVFPRFHLDHQDLGLTFTQFKETLDLNDGGVMSNLGIEVLLALRPLGWGVDTFTLVGDAERPQTVKPGDSPTSDIEAQQAALSQAAREQLKVALGQNCALVRLSGRVPDNKGLSFRTETLLAGFRTDLDAPSWQEIRALIIHGAFTAASWGEGLPAVISPDALYGAISAIITQAGGPADLPVPGEKDLKRCSRRPLGRVLQHGLLVLLIMAGFLFALAKLASWALLPDTAPRSSPTVLRGSVDLLVLRKNAIGVDDLMPLQDVRALPLRPGDRFRIDATVDPPAHVYLFWINSAGAAEPVYPWEEWNQVGRAREANAEAHVGVPEEPDKGYKFKCPGTGLDTLVMLARSKPLTASGNEVKAWFGALPEGRPLPSVDYKAWFENFLLVKNDPQRRATFEREDLNLPAFRLQAALQLTLAGKADLIRAVSFAVEKP